MSHRFDISPKAIIRDAAGRVLVIRRHAASRHWPGEWDLPGGRTEPGETFAQTLIREAKEETGLDIELAGFVGAAPCDLPRVRLVFLVMEAQATGGEPRLSDEHSEMRWVTDGQLASLGLLAPIAAALRGRGGPGLPLESPPARNAPMTYRPDPIDTTAASLPADLVALTERLAENAHDIWAQRRMAEGWTYGPQRDDVARKHPDLVPYDQLTEAEKEYDRQTAMQTLKAILALGYRIGPR